MNNCVRAWNKLVVLHKHTVIEAAESLLWVSVDIANLTLNPCCHANIRSELKSQDNNVNVLELPPFYDAKSLPQSPPTKVGVRWGFGLRVLRCIRKVSNCPHLSLGCGMTL